MSSAAQLIRQYLVDQSLGVDYGTEDADTDWPAFYSNIPEDANVSKKIPDRAIGVLDTAGTMDGRLMPTGTVIEHPGIQIKVRGKAGDYRTAYNKAVAIAASISTIHNTTVVVASVYYRVNAVKRTGSILDIGPNPDDSRRRQQFTINGIVTFSAL